MRAGRIRNALGVTGSVLAAACTSASHGSPAEPAFTDARSDASDHRGPSDARLPEAAAPSGSGGVPQRDAAPGDARKAPPLLTVFLILLENKDWWMVEGNTTSAPYVNHLIQSGAAYCTGFHNVVGDASHPSEPNYLILEAGDPLGVTDNESPAINCRRGERQGIPWRSYQEGITGAVCPLENDHLYVPRHNPMVYFDDVSGADCADEAAPNCLANVRPTSATAATTTARAMRSARPTIGSASSSLS